MKNLNTGSVDRYSKEVVAYLVGRGDIENLSGQLYESKVIYRGVGVNLRDLKVYTEKQLRAVMDMELDNKLVIISKNKNGRTVESYNLIDSKGNTCVYGTEKMIDAIRSGRVKNASVQMLHGKYLVRGLR